MYVREQVVNQNNSLFNNSVSDFIVVTQIYK